MATSLAALIASDESTVLLASAIDGEGSAAHSISMRHVRRLAARIRLTRLVDDSAPDHTAGVARARVWLAAERAALTQRAQAVGDRAQEPELRRLFNYFSSAQAELEATVALVEAHLTMSAPALRMQWEGRRRAAHFFRGAAQRGRRRQLGEPIRISLAGPGRPTKYLAGWYFGLRVTGP